MNGIQYLESERANERAEAAFATFENRRLAREWKTMQAMVRIYCNNLHGTAGDVCAECRDFLGYASRRLERCRFGPEKPTCANCPVHCYQRARRDQVRAIMRYAGPRMLWRHPVLSLLHWVDGFRKAPSC
ncbi:MAG TPA: nitrous oxide-stimulated promoter family protein [Verrucomicrobiota bacterium]|nr:nitrous oxide-stimulated promoter family protein [Verrucomicrobiota bacterium]HOP96891.1 nitrous oxide-stimulated promoter family protein [Verrucomicrobiota bacterium]